MNDMTVLLPDLRLRFNIAHPSFEDCYAYGYECAVAEISEEENPYRLGSKESEHWLEGWWAGFYGEKPLHQIENEENLNQLNASNDHFYHGNRQGFFTKIFEITGMIVVSAAVGYQLIDLVA